MNFVLDMVKPPSPIEFRGALQRAVLHEDGRHLGAAGVVLRQQVELARVFAAADDLLRDGPLHVVHGPVGHARAVGKSGQLSGGLSLVGGELRGVAAEDGHDLLARDVALRGERRVGRAGDNAVLVGPEDSLSVPRIRLDIRERHLAAHARAAGQTVEHGDEHSARHGHVGAERRVGRADHEALVVGVERGVIVPRAGRHIRERGFGQLAHVERELYRERHGIAAGGVGVARLFDGGAVACDAGLLVVRAALDGGDIADVVLADDLAEVKQAHAVFRTGECVAAGQLLHVAGVGLGVLDGQTGQIERGELVAAAVDLAQVCVFRHVKRGELVVLAVERRKLREVLNAGQVGDAEVAAVELRHMAQLERRELAVAVDIGRVGEQGAEGRVRERLFIERDAARQALHLKVHGHGRQALAPGVVAVGEIVRRLGVHGGAGLLIVVCVRHARDAAEVIFADDGVEVHGALLLVHDGAGLLRQVLRAEDRVFGLAVALRSGVERGAAAQVERGERVVAAVKRLERGAAREVELCQASVICNASFKTF